MNAQNSQDRDLIKIILELNKALVREQYRILALKELPKNKIRPPYHFYLN